MKLYLLPFLILAACRSEPHYAGKNSPVNFGKSGIITLTGATYAEKRGFIDMNGDSVTDMVEISDAFGPGGYYARIFHGYWDTKDGKTLIAFRQPKRVTLPLEAKFFSSQTKVDTADINGDGFGDLVITQYTQGVFADVFYVAVAVNQGDESFKLTKSVNREEIPLGDAMLRIMDALEGEHEDLRPWFKMDWADVNGDRKDDLCLFWGTGSMWPTGIYVETFVSSTPVNEKSSLTFSSKKFAENPTYLRSFDIWDLDTADMNGDGKADIITWYPKSGTAIDFSILLNQGSQGDSMQFSSPINLAKHEIETEFVGFEKRDTFDVNNDECADYVHAGQIDDKPVLTYLLNSSCS